MRPIVSKQFCSKTEKVFTMKRRPCVVKGSGFVVTDNDDSVEAFRSEGCGKAVKKETILSDPNGNFILSIRKQVSLVHVLCLKKQWKGFARDGVEEGHEKFVFKVTAAASLVASFGTQPLLKVTLADKNHDGYSWDYQVVGSFVNRACTVYDNAGSVAAEVKPKAGILRALMEDLSSVSVCPGIDQAFIFGVVAVLERLSQD